jgi:hypothetical protein
MYKFWPLSVGVIYLSFFSLPFFPCSFLFYVRILLVSYLLISLQKYIRPFRTDVDSSDQQVPHGRLTSSLGRNFFSHTHPVSELLSSQYLFVDRVNPE